MERPPSLRAYMEETGMPRPWALKEWELILMAFQKQVREQDGNQTTIEE